MTGRPRSPCSLCNADRSTDGQAHALDREGYYIPVCASCKAWARETRDRRRSGSQSPLNGASRMDVVEHLRSQRERYRVDAGVRLA